MTSSPSRRQFIVAAGTASVSSVFPKAFAQPPAGVIQVGVRENVAFMSDDHPTLMSYRKAIAEMATRPEADPLSWAFQANMHGKPPNGATHEGWNWCQHGNWWFLPWHRGYVYFFERIIRKLSGDDFFRLPYWSWEQPGNNILPAPFRPEKFQGKPNPLFEPTRRIANAGGPLRPSPLSSFAAEWERTRRTIAFSTPFAERSFGGVNAPNTTLPNHPTSGSHGVMESQAHDYLHVAVGASATGTAKMGKPNTAAQDPIFWLHHANVDRLWNRWLDGREHSNPSEQEWGAQKFPFYDENGQRVEMSVDEILTQAAAHYRYDDDKRRGIVAMGAAKPEMLEGIDVKPKVVTVGAIQPMLSLGAKAFTKPIKLDEGTKQVFMTALAAPGETPSTAQAVLLRVEGIKPPEEPKVAFEVFLTKTGQKPAEGTYVGSISFFGRGAEGHNKGHGAMNGFTQGFDVSDVVQRLKRANKGELPDLEVTVLPRSTTGLSEEELSKQKVDIPISNITLMLVTPEKK